MDGKGEGCIRSHKHLMVAYVGQIWGREGRRAYERSKVIYAKRIKVLQQAGRKLGTKEF